MRRGPLALALGAALAVGAAQAQLYRWVDRDGQVRYTDTPPPSWAKDVKKRDSRAAPVPPPQEPFELQRVQKDFPVSLYTSPNCQEPCSKAREALNKRGVPFKEVQVWEEGSNEELKRVSGSNEVPTLTVGRTVHKGFEQGTYDTLLDTAGYPKAGVLPVGSQAAPAAPEGYVAPAERDAQKPVPEPLKAEPEESKPTGPYAPKPPAAKPK